MASAAGNLPHELLILINESLSAEDRYASLFVCRQWYIVFVQLFYKSVTIMSLSRCNKFYRTLQQSAKQQQFPLQPLALGLIVRGLTIKQHSPPPKIMQQLPSLCPNLESLEFIKTEDRLVSYDKDSTERYTASLTPNRGVMSQLLFTYYRHLPLTHLSLECYSGVRNLVFLAVMPQLEHLTLKLKGEWRMDDMDMVHSLCPRLQSLQVTATLFEFSMHDGINFDFETEPALHLTKIRLNIDRGLSASGYLPWIVYFARKYPRLQELYLGGRFDPEIAYDLFPEEDGRRDNDILPVTLFPEVAQFRQERDETRTRAYAIFFKSCRELRSLHLTNMRLYRGFFDQMVHNGGVLPLQHLAIHDEMLFPRTPIRNAVLLFSQTLTSLSLYAENNGDGDWRFTAQLDVPGLLGHLPQLRHLSLGDMHDISLSTMLDKAPQLETLMVVHVRLNLQHAYGPDGGLDDMDSDDERAESDRQRSHDAAAPGGLRLRPNLKELTIQRTPLTQNILDHISRRCTGLTHITLEHCGVHGSRSGSLILDMPYHQLQMLHLDNLVFKDDEGFLRYYTGEDFHVKTFAVQTEDTGCRCFRSIYPWLNQGRLS